MGKKMGAPTKYNSSFCQITIDLMDDGKSIYQVARHLRVSRQTLYTWMDKYPDFMDAIRVGKDWGQGYWEEEFQRMMYTREGQPQLWRLYMGSRFGWEEKATIIDQETATPKSIQVEIVDARKPD